MIPTGTSACYHYMQTTTSDLGWDMAPGDCVVTFTGTDATNKNNQWVLLELDSSGGNSTDQSLTLGYGNRYYLKNNNFTDNSDTHGRIRYEPFALIGAGGSAMCPSTTFAVAGGECSAPTCAYTEELIIYFLPTLFPDLYYLLFPSIITANPFNPDFAESGNLIQNNGMISCRVFSAPNDTNWEFYHPNCNYMDANFSPYCVNSTSGPGSCSGSDGPLNANGMLMNTLPSIPAMPPYNNFPNVYLFRVTKVP